MYVWQFHQAKNEGKKKSCMRGSNHVKLPVILKHGHNTSSRLLLASSDLTKFMRSSVESLRHQSHGGHFVAIGGPGYNLCSPGSPDSAYDWYRRICWEYPVAHQLFHTRWPYKCGIPLNGSLGWRWGGLFLRITVCKPREPLLRNRQVLGLFADAMTYYPRPSILPIPLSISICVSAGSQ